MCSKFCQHLAYSTVDRFLRLIYRIGSCVDGIKSPRNLTPWRRHKTIVICIIGLGQAGKTTIVKAVQGDNLQNVHSTIGFSRAEMEVKSYKIISYDLGGEEKIRDIWTNYYAEIYGVVYVVNSAADKHEMDINRQMLEKLGSCQDLQGKPFLIFLNKKDIPNAIDELQFSDDCKLHSLAKQIGAGIRIESVSAIQGTGKEIDTAIIDGFDWLIDQILNKYADIEKGVQIALIKLKQKQSQEKLERQHRLAVLTARRAAESPERPSTSEIPSPEGVQQKNIKDESEKIANGNLANVAMEIETNLYDYDPPNRIQRILEQAKKMKQNKVAPTGLIIDPEPGPSGISMNQLEKKTNASYDNRAYEPEIQILRPKTANELGIDRLQLHSRQENHQIENSSHEWHEIKSI